MGEGDYHTVRLTLHLAESCRGNQLRLLQFGIGRRCQMKGILHPELTHVTTLEQWAARREAQFMEIHSQKFRLLPLTEGPPQSMGQLGLGFSETKHSQALVSIHSAAPINSVTSHVPKSAGLKVSARHW
uniref:Uncharacterized protein n=1 Tax=Gopherus evgoodei TaxID=1825980 RepID=A0A8C4YKH6_9SAUR